jgi:hypothetical protein
VSEPREVLREEPLIETNLVLKEASVLGRVGGPEVLHDRVAWKQAHDQETDKRDDEQYAKVLDDAAQ